MKITRTGSLSSRPLRRVARSKDGGDGKKFGEELSAGEATETAPAARLTATAGVDSLLSVQEVDDPAGRPAKARQRAETLLDRLDELRHGLLAGALSRRQLEQLARMVRMQRLDVDDPNLAEILDQIELRAEIELAKYSTLD